MGRPVNGYVNAAGKPIIGVTSVLSRFKTGDALLQWAYRQGLDHGAARQRGEPTARSVYEVRDQAAQSGTLAHDMIECYILGRQFTPPVKTPLPNVWRNAVNAFEQFKRWWSQTKLEIVFTEKWYVSEKYQFGGTLDGIGARNSDGQIVLLDWKTSAGVYPDMLMQLAAYSILLEENEPEFYPHGGYHIIRCAKRFGDFAHHYFEEVDAARQAFLHLLAALPFVDEIEERVK